MNSNIFLMQGKKTRMAEITQNGQKSLTFIVVHKQRESKKKYLVPLMKKVVVIKAMIVVINSK